MTTTVPDARTARLTAVEDRLDLAELLAAYARDDHADLCGPPAAHSLR